MPKLSGFRPTSFDSIPLGPGVALANVTDITPEGILAAVRGDETVGQRLGAMTAAPSFSAEPEVLNLTENIVGLAANVKGATQLQSMEASCTLELAELSVANLKIIHPGLDETEWTGASTDGGTTPGSRVGSRLRPRSYYQDSDYAQNIVIAMESTRQAVFAAIVLYNCISNDATELELDDDGNVSGMSVTLLAHSSMDQWDESVGQFSMPYDFYIADLAAEPVA